MALRILLLMALPLAAAERTHTVVPEDYFSLATITEVAVSPDGKQVAYAEARWSKDDDLRKGDVWVIATDGKSKPMRLRFDRASDHHLKWSADSKLIYTLGSRKRASETKAPYDGKPQVWAIPAVGGEPRAITKETAGVDHFDLAAKDNSVVYSVSVTANDADEFAALRSKYKLDYGHGVRKVSEIYRVGIDDWRTDKVYVGKRYVRELAVTTDGKKIAMVTAYDDTIVKSEGESRVDILMLGEPGTAGRLFTPPTDVYRKNAASPNAWLENLAWNADGTRCVFNAIFDGYPASLIHLKLEKNSWKVECIDNNNDRQIGSYARASGPMNQFLNNMQLVMIDERHTRSGLYRYEFDSDVVEKNSQNNDDKQPHIYGYSIHPAIICIISARQGKFAELEKIERGIDLNYNPNPHTEKWEIPIIRSLTWKAPDGSSVGGVLELPPGYDGKTKLPLIVAIHGGPTTSSKAALEFDPHNGRMYFSTAGYAVLCPNYRGSTGYGDKFVTDLIGHENDIEVNDIIAGVQHLVKEGIADPERVGVMGWSNGGYLTNCVITRKGLPFTLKAASSGAGIVDTVAEWGFNDEPAYPRVFKKGNPWEVPDNYRKTSPTYDLGNIKTPTIVHVGGNDVRCPPGHSRMLYRAMKEYLNVPCELCEYPGEPHGLTTMTHRRAKMEWDLAWFNKYMK